MTPEQEAAIRAAINNKKIDIGATRIEIEDLEIDIGLIAARNSLAQQLDELDELYRQLNAGIM